jgi:hypothetical protein
MNTYKITWKYIDIPPETYIAETPGKAKYQSYLYWQDLEK